MYFYSYYRFSDEQNAERLLYLLYMDKNYDGFKKTVPKVGA